MTVTITLPPDLNQVFNPYMLDPLLGMKMRVENKIIRLSLLKV